jgi:Leucine-rich repeat (LRR) protein
VIEGGRVKIDGRIIGDLGELPSGDYQVEMIDWVAVNAVPEDLERMTGLRKLRELRLPGPLWNRNADGGKDLSKLLQFLAPVTTLEKLTFSDHFLDRIRFRDAGLDAIAGLQGIREFALRQAEVKGPGLRHFKQLESVDVTLCPVPDLQWVRGMTRLRRLWAGDTFVSDLAPLAELTALEDLDLHGTAIGDGTIQNLGALKKLRRLDLQGTQVTDAAVATLAGLKDLESLNLYRTKISNAGLSQLSQLPRLRNIDVRYTRVTASGYDAFRAARPGAQVQFAGGGGRQVPRIAPPAGQDQRQIAEWIRSIGGTVRQADGFISLRGIPLNEEAVAALTRLSGLRVLDLEATDIGDAAMAQLSRIGTLEELTLNSTQVSDAGLKAFRSMPSLKRLRLNHTYVEGSAFSEWTPGSPLQELSLLGTPIRDSAMEGIARFTRLERLILAESDVTGAGLAALASLPLTHLDLSAADVGDDAPLSHFPQLRSLRLRDTRISDLMLARQLVLMKNLEVLDLARTRISSAGISRLGELRRLRDLNLSYAELDDDGLSKLDGLTELQSLNLDSTHITDASTAVLARFPNLVQLDLYHSLISPAGLAGLRAARPGIRVIWDKESGMPHRRRA